MYPPQPTVYFGILGKVNLTRPSGNVTFLSKDPLDDELFRGTQAGLFLRMGKLVHDALLVSGQLKRAWRTHLHKVFGCVRVVGCAFVCVCLCVCVYVCVHVCVCVSIQGDRGCFHFFNAHC